MGCVLRVTGEKFNPAAFLSPSALKRCARVFKKGAYTSLFFRNPSGRAKSKIPAADQRCKTSGFSILISDTDFDDLPAQIQDAIEFLALFWKDLSRLKKDRAVERATLDFGIRNRGKFVEVNYFPAELIRLAGRAGLGIVINRYPISTPEKSCAKKGKQKCE